MNGPQYNVMPLNNGAVLALIDHDVGMTITNAAEKVCDDLHRHYKLPGRRVIYRDTAGQWDELRHENGHFVAFAPTRERGLAAAMKRLGFESISFDPQPQIEEASERRSLDIADELHGVARKVYERLRASERHGDPTIHMPAGAARMLVRLLIEEHLLWNGTLPDMPKLVGTLFAGSIIVPAIKVELERAEQLQKLDQVREGTPA